MRKTNSNFLQVCVTEKPGSQLGKQIKGQPESNCSPTRSFVGHGGFAHASLWGTQPHKVSLS